MAQAKLKPLKEKKITDGNNAFSMETANESMERAAKMEVPNMLFSEFIFETDLTVLFSTSGVGKTILAMQIADAISKGESIDGFENQAEAQRVLYFDLELTPKQFQSRYAQKDVINGKPIYHNDYKFSDNLLVARFQNYDMPKGISPIDFLCQSIVERAKEADVKIIFVDNISWLATQGLETAKDASKLMKALDKLKKENNLTLVVLAHTPKKSKSEAIELRDLAGSAMVGNFCDAAFTINWSNYQGENNSRYLKQVKCRFSEKVYHQDNVITGMIAKVRNNFTGFEREVSLECDSYKTEGAHLQRRELMTTQVFTEEQAEERRKLLKVMMKDFPEATKQEYANKLGCHRDTVYEDLKKIKQEEINFKDDSDGDAATV